ncbi:2-amino-4-hydroxy-6-hydroxymethyldihydropteridine diphosphokinase [Campylobacter pinnipediorum subsp. pinnipediorum]|uniref:2-amino-4-hydroxy-6-hydroxymethyldihydropteridine pyrophosphokinase n=1 Tax=Campylobacter pinnipediorum subsp. pinnipediorum TaxID=1660067 RepID=A0AAX0LCL1_9BACT|nr:2-amino-4-hydroxy-6-hydroxymethyldihydropteridine diphosphokinase [Campylobacter pinnipediorum]OPA81799.1 2-amino-4-hydroxy-6-hydroxymethyldihydropteridine diphosphokinase [Campylobacter pinnipediorum subsp. pinnipediorum]
MIADGARSITSSSFFPKYFGFKNNFKFNTLIGVGGNIGNTKKIFDRFIRALKNDKRFHIVETSPILINKAFGYIYQNDFSNAVINLQTSVSPYNLLKIMQNYEKIFRRTRSFKNAPRTIDLDILYFSNKVRKTSKLTIPHIGANQRLSVIIPLGLMKA